MSGAKNSVTVTFVGDEKDLTRSFAAAQAGAKATGEAFTKAGQKAEESTRGLSHVAEATDHVDTLGAKATSSLGALSSGAQLLGARGEGAAKGLMTAALATDFLSGVGEAATIATETLGKTVSKAKEAVAGLTTNIKANAKSYAAMGVGITAAVALVTIFIAKQRAEQESVTAVARSLNFQSGAYDKANRAAVQKELADLGLLESGHKLGLTTDDLTDAVLGNAEAMNRVNKATETGVGGLGRATSAQGRLSDAVREFAAKVKDQATNQSLVTAATDDSTAAYEDQATAIDRAKKALQDYNTALHDELDPSANLFHRLQDLKQAQKDYTDAVKEHGRKSPEARQANIDLAAAVLAARDASAEAGGTFHGTFSSAMHDALIAAHFTEQQIKDLEKALRDTKAAADKLDGTKITVTEYHNIHTNHFDKYTGDPISGRASGGNVKAGKTYKVGEHGVELVTFGQDGYVHNAAESAAMMGGWSSQPGGGGTIDVNVKLNAAGAANDLKNLFLSWLRVDAGFRATVKGYVG